MPPPLHILHCPDVVGGFGYALARAERRLGQQSWSVAFDAGPYRLENDEYLWRPGDSRLRKEVGRWRLLWRALRDFDGPDRHTPVAMAVRGPKARALAAEVADTVTFVQAPDEPRAEVTRLARDLRGNNAQ